MCRGKQLLEVSCARSLVGMTAYAYIAAFDSPDSPVVFVTGDSIEL